MLRTINNLLYRGKDPTRAWVPNPSAVSVDLHLCTLCGVKVGGLVDGGTGLQALGPTQDAKRASRGYLEWYSQGISSLVDQGRLYDFTLAMRGWGKNVRDYPGKITLDGTPVEVARLNPDALQKLIGDPFAQSTKGDLVLFYEYDHAEVEYAFDDDGTLNTIEFAYESELAVKRVRQYYGIEKELPEAIANRKLA